ncbi:MAG: response regulator [Lachnospira sp.]|nr:response regulator [Lachnospira sp.]
MDKRILFVCRSKNFMVNAFLNNLKTYGFECDVVAPDIRILSKQEDFPIIVLYLDDEISPDYTESMVYLKDKAGSSHEEILVYSIGAGETLEESKRIFGDSLLKKPFLRPINVKEVIEEINNDVEKEELFGNKKHILVIDDDPTMLNTIKGWLSGKYTVYMADSGMNGISVLARHHIDLVLLDFEMPVITGAKVLEMIRSESTTSNIPVMFLTAKGDKEHVMQVVSLKPEKYLLKSMPAEELIANVDEFFAKQKAKELSLG